MIVRVLGSAAGGGVPQWNCACAHCGAARTGKLPRRTQSSFAVSSDGTEGWWLINVSPDAAQQIEAYPPLHPRGDRNTPLRGMLLTDANIDHIGGLTVLRQGGEHAFTLYSSAVVKAIALEQRAFAPFSAPPHHWHALAPGERVRLDARLEVRAVPVEGLTPGYAGRRSIPGAVIAYALRDQVTGGRVLFAPVFKSIDLPLLQAIRNSDVVFLDGSFWSDEELSTMGPAKSARALGHLPVGAPDGPLTTLRNLPCRRFLTHINNTNPLLDPTSREARLAGEEGFETAEDGLELRL